MGPVVNIIMIIVNEFFFFQEVKFRDLPSVKCIWGRRRRGGGRHPQARIQKIFKGGGYGEICWNIENIIVSSHGLGSTLVGEDM